MEKNTQTNSAPIRGIADELRGKAAPKTNNAKNVFVLALLFFSALNTFRLFGASFGALGLGIAIAAIIMFDGGYLFWNNQVVTHTKGDKQKRIAEFARDASMFGCAAMIALDMALHSGQQYIPLDLEILAFGWSAILKDIFGGFAMFLLVGMFLFHAWSISRFEKEDIAVKQAIEERKAHHDEEELRLSMLRAKNAIKREITAETILEIEGGI